MLIKVKCLLSNLENANYASQMTLSFLFQFHAPRGLIQVATSLQMEKTPLYANIRFNI